MSDARLDDRPGFRRRFIVTPRPGQVRSEVEDDYHRMSVDIHHRDGIAVAVEGRVERAPWTTCPGAPAQLKATFTGAPLSAFAARGEKPANCTHLYDLAMLAAAHADDEGSTVYEVLVADPVDGRSRAELRRNGAALFTWTLEGFTIVEPPEAAGVELLKLRPVLERLDAAGQEAAKVLRWAAMIAHGRAIPMENQSDATRMPPNCYTFQPDRKVQARRVGLIRDFSRSADQPLDGRVEAAFDDASGGVCG